jgi:hypothetical protein
VLLLLLLPGAESLQGLSARLRRCSAEASGCTATTTVRGSQRCDRPGGGGIGSTTAGSSLENGGLSGRRLVVVVVVIKKKKLQEFLRKEP